MRITFSIADNDVMQLAEKIQTLLHALVALNLEWLQGRERIPSLDGVRYVKERGENWKDIPHVLATMTGDCEDLACFRVAELLAQGEYAEPDLDVYLLDNGNVYMHVLVNRGDHREDPSRVLGMEG